MAREEAAERLREKIFRQNRKDMENWKKRRKKSIYFRKNCRS